MEEKRFDLHMHSNCSDGSDAPALVVEHAKDAGLALMALTDHDTVCGVPEALEAGRAQGVAVLPALEMDTEYPGEMHILGLGVDIESPALTHALAVAGERRIARNRVILERLKAAGYDIAPFLSGAEGSVTRLHIALALIEAGYAESIHDAFARYLRRGGPGYYTVTRFSPEEVLSILLAAGGTPVWAHPYHLEGNLLPALDMLVANGLMGIEAYHPSASEGQSKTLLSLARQRKLLVTCGSDSHGSHRQNTFCGCTWRDTPELNQTFDFLSSTYFPHPSTKNRIESTGRAAN